eukprot:15366177-Ditylum_brightwellii.AAC.1
MRGISCEKDHKALEEDGSFPTRLVIPATNFTATSSKLGYLGIKQILDDNKALTHYSCNLSNNDKMTINECLGLIKFGMRNMLVQYYGKYYAYKGAAKGQVMGDKDVALAIGAYEAAFCTNVVASYVFKMTETLVNRIVGGGFLQFTTEVWAPTVFQSKFDMLHKGEMRDAPDAKWLKRVKLRFNVLNKKKQAIKYVENGSTHCLCTFKSITLGVYTRLGRLTLKTPENAKLQIDELYPLHVEALLTTDLEPVEFPTMGENWKKEKDIKEKLSDK